MKRITNVLGWMARVCCGLENFSYSINHSRRIVALEQESLRHRRQLHSLHYRVQAMKARTAADVRREIIAMKPSIN